MQDDFNSAPTPAMGQPTPPGAAANGATQPASPGAGPQRAPGQPLGVINPQVAPAPAQPPAPAQAGGWNGQTVSYHGPIAPIDPQTLADPQPPSPWPTNVSPNAPTVYRPQPSGPPIYQPGAPAALPPIAPPAVSPAVPTARPPARRSGARPPQSSAPRRQPQRPPASARRPSWLPIPHALLLLGVGLLYVATLLPWGVDANGQIIMLQTATVPAISTQGGDGTAMQTANDLISVVGGLSVALLLSNVFLSGLNKVLGRGCIAGCAIAPLYPLLIAVLGALLIAQAVTAGFGGLGALAQAPGAQYGVASLGVAHYELGYYLWYTGIMLNVAGMLGELVVWRS